MTSQNKLYSLLKDISNVYPVKAPSGVTSYIIYSLLSTNPNPSKDGTSLCDDERWQLDCYASTLAGADALADSVREWIDGYHADGIKIDFADRTQGKYDDERELYVSIIDFYVESWRDGSIGIQWDFEGTLTVGSMPGEGGITEHGYRAGWGDDFGSIANFYTQYEYAGFYWNDDSELLLVWGVNAEVIKIGSTVYTGGTFNEEGYTSFSIATNPFTGATAAIKIKGSVTEVWDYTGVLTVGSRSVYGEVIDEGYDTGNEGQYGFITPAYNYTYGKESFIKYNLGSEHLQISGEITCLKIDNIVYKNISRETGMSFILGLTSSPLPAFEETCTIKISVSIENNYESEA